MFTTTRAYRALLDRLPGKAAAKIDLHSPSLSSSWGGPLNGQQARCAIVREISRLVVFDRVVETGTFRGTSTEFFSAVFGTPVETVEASPRYFAYSRARLDYLSNVRVTKGDSRSFLRSLSETPDLSGETTFFYLDAHWEKDLPLKDELSLIGARWHKAIVMIDDFKVPGDSGYGFDDYGYGMALSEDYIPASALSGWELRFPKGRSAQETGAKRGCAVLISPLLISQLKIALTLKPGRLLAAPL